MTLQENIDLAEREYLISAQRDHVNQSTVMALFEIIQSLRDVAAEHHKEIENLKNEIQFMKRFSR